MGQFQIDKRFRFAQLCVWMAGISILLLMVFRGTPQVDEPMYLIKAKEFTRGWPLIYKETPWSTPPMHMVLFSPLAFLAHYDLLISRLLHLVFLLPGLWILWRLFQVAWPGWGGLTGWAMVLSTPLMAYFLVLIKHHALEYSLILPACYLLVTQWKSPTLFMPLSMALACLIACVRAPYFAAPVSLWIYFLLFYPKEFKGLLLSLLAFLLVFGLCLAPFVLGSFDQFKFGIWEMTAGYFQKKPTTLPGFFQTRVAYLIQTFRSYPFSVLILLVLLSQLRHLPQKAKPIVPWINKHHSILWLFLWPLSWTSPVLFTQNPQINWIVTLLPIWLVVACFLASGQMDLPSISPKSFALGAIGFVLLGALLNFPFGLSRHNPLTFVQPSTAFINHHVKKGEWFFSCQLFEGPQALGLPLPGSAGSIFGYQPEWREASPKTQKFGVFTKEGLAKAMAEKKLKAIVLTNNYCPDFSQEPLNQLLKTHYRLALEIPNYGQGQLPGYFYLPVP